MRVGFCFCGIRVRFGSNENPTCWICLISVWFAIQQNPTTPTSNQTKTITNPTCLFFVWFKSNQNQTCWNCMTFYWFKQNRTCWICLISVGFATQQNETNPTWNPTKSNNDPTCRNCVWSCWVLLDFKSRKTNKPLHTFPKLEGVEVRCVDMWQWMG